MEEKEFDYMNVIPLVDVMLVLLTIVLTTSTFIATGVIPVNLPKASDSPTSTVKSQLIEIDRRGHVYLNSKPVSLKVLEESLSAIRKDTPLLIRADRDIALQVFVNVLDVLKTLDLKKINLQTEEAG